MDATTGLRNSSTYAVPPAVTGLMMFLGKNCVSVGLRHPVQPSVSFFSRPYTVALMLQCCVCRRLSVRNVLWLNGAS